MTTVVKFGVEWCPACKHSKKPFAQLQSEYHNITFYDVDLDEMDSNTLPSKIVKKGRRVKRMPTFWVFNDNAEGELVGWNEEKIKKIIHKVQNA